MANIFDKFLNSMKLYEEDDEEDFDDEEFEDEEEEEPAPRFRRAPKPEPEEPAFRRPVQEEPKPAPRPQPQAPKRAANNVVNMRSQRSTSTMEKTMEVCMIRPNKLDDAREICETLLSGRAVVINMEGVHVDLAQRIIDFTSGACFSVEGNLQKISKYIFIVSPASIDLTGDFQQALDNQNSAQQDISTLSLDF